MLCFFPVLHFFFCLGMYSSIAEHTHTHTPLSTRALEKLLLEEKKKKLLEENTSHKDKAGVPCSRTLMTHVFILHLEGLSNF